MNQGIPATDMTGGEAVVAALRSLGVRHVFGIVSIHNLPIYDALARDGSITVVCARHEQAAVHAADGYARATGGLGVALTSTGPGAANGAAGLFEASSGSSPVLMVTGQVASRLYGRTKGCFHEAEHQLEMLRSVTRMTSSVSRTEDVIRVIQQVAGNLRRGRPQPGAVEIPIDLQHASARFALTDPEPGPIAPPDPELLDQAGEILSQARRPLIWSGGGVISGGAAKEVTELAGRLSAPVVTSVQGRGAVPEDHALALGALAPSTPVTETIADADVVLAVGTRFQEDDTLAWTVPIRGRLLHLDADSQVIGRNYPAHLGIVGDARLGLAGLLDGVRASATDPAFTARAQRAREAARAAGRSLIGPDHAAVMDTIRRHLPRSGIVVRDATVPAYMWADRLLPVYEPGTAIYPSSGAIGPGLPLALGAALGAQQPTVLIEGDGGMMLNLGELATVAQYRVPLVICLFNDHGYGMLRAVQDKEWGGRRLGVDLSTPDFSGVARAFGLAGERVNGVDGFQAGFSRAITSGEPTLLDIDLASLAPVTITMDWA